MKKNGPSTTIYWSTEELSAITQVAEHSGVSITDVIRESLRICIEGFPTKRVIPARGKPLAPGADDRRFDHEKKSK